MDGNQKILCAAIWYQTGQSHKHQPKNLSTGFVVIGRRHHNCIMTVAILAGDKSKLLRSFPSVEGFLTDKNIFLERAEACELAIYNGQANKETVSGKLYSEDLY